MILGVLQARTSSTRLPQKVLLPLGGRPMIVRQMERMRRSRKVDRWVLATSDQAEDAILCEMATSVGFEFHQGSLNDVLDRFYQAASRFSPGVVVRTTGDCPFFDPGLLDEGIEEFERQGVDYLSNCLQPTFPDGLDFEVFSFKALERAWREADLPSEREHVTPFLYKKSSGFGVHCVRNPRGDFSSWRLTVDEPRDYELICRIYDELSPRRPDFGFDDLVEFLSSRSGLMSLNSDIVRNEGYLKSLAADLAVKKGSHHNG